MAAERLATMTVAIASYQRRRSLERLLRTLSAQLAGSTELRAGLDIVVVLDGSSDGSYELVESLNLPVPTRVVWQRNRGLASARNAGLAATEGELVWFLDDDVVPAPGLVEHHRRCADPDDRSVVVGPCLPAPWHRVHPLVRKFWAERHDDLRARGQIRRFDQFSAANTSGPTGTFRDVGGFDPAFVGYGAEDYELAVRLLGADVTPRYVPDALAWHEPPHGAIAMCRRQRSEAANQIRLVRTHPHTLEEVFPPPRPVPELDVIRRLRLYRHPRLLRALATSLLPAVAVEERITNQRGWRILGLASVAMYMSGIARHDPDGSFTRRALGVENL